MGKILQLRAWQKEKGLTLVETVVSLSIILIITIAAVSISIYSTNSLRIASVKRFFNHEIDSICEMYVTYDNESDFSNAFLLYTGKTISGYTNTVFYLNSSLNYLDTSEGSDFYISLSFEGATKLDISSFSNTGTALANRSVTR